MREKTADLAKPVGEEIIDILPEEPEAE